MFDAANTADLAQEVDAVTNGDALAYIEAGATVPQLPFLGALASFLQGISDGRADLKAWTANEFLRAVRAGQEPAAAMVHAINASMPYGPNVDQGLTNFFIFWRSSPHTSPEAENFAIAIRITRQHEGHQTTMATLMRGYLERRSNMDAMDALRGMSPSVARYMADNKL